MTLEGVDADEDQHGDLPGGRAKSLLRACVGEFGKEGGQWKNGSRDL
jgi:hypothetical protein